MEILDSELDYQFITENIPKSCNFMSY